jgi:putative MATE family efflux protein
MFKRMMHLFSEVKHFSHEDAALPKKRRRWIFLIAIPIIVQNLVQHLQLVIDRAFLGHLDTAYLSALGNVMTPFSAFNLFLMTTSTGLTIHIAQKLGSGNKNLAKLYSESSFLYSSLLAGGIYLIWLFGAQGIFGLLGTGEGIKEYAIIYVQTVAVSLVFLGVESTSTAILQGVGITFPLMVGGIIKNVLNILLDWLLIFGHFGLPAKGLQGAAVATLISNAVGSMVIIIYVLATKRLPFRFSWKNILWPKFQPYWETMKLGLPSGLESFLWFSGQIVLTRMVNDLDPLAMGIVSLVQGIYLLGLLIYLGFARAATTIVGNLWGAKQFLLARTTGYHTQRLGLYVSFAWSVVMLFFPKELAMIFSSDTYVIKESILMIRLAALFVNFQAINVIIGHSIRGTGDTRWMLYTQIAGTVFVVVVSYLAMFPLGMNLSGLYFTLIADEIIRSIVNTLRFHQGKNPFSLRERIQPEEGK